MSIVSKLFFLACTLLFATSSKAQAPGEKNRLSRFRPSFITPRFAGAVYVMSNDLEENSVLAFGRLPNGTLLSVGSFPTGGKGAIIDEMDGIDPLFSAFALFLTPDNRFVIAVNAGSRSVSVFMVQPDFSLKLTSEVRVSGFGPASIAFSNGIVYVASLEADTMLPENFTIFELKGALTGFRLTQNGNLLRIPKSVRRLNNRPSAIKFSPDGRTLLVTSIAAGSVELGTDVVEELSSFRLRRDGSLSRKPVSVVTSTELGNEEGRNLPSAIGFDTVQVNGTQYVVVAEPRVIGPDGEIADLQTPSISVWEIKRSGTLVPSHLDVLVGTSILDGQRATCWVEFSVSGDIFWVANTATGSISAFSFKDGRAELVEEEAGNAETPIDLWRSSDGKFLYQLSPGAVDAFKIGENGSGPGLTPIQTLTEVPDQDVQGIVAI